jgi:hypothetical protein
MEIKKLKRGSERGELAGVRLRFDLVPGFFHCVAV